MRITIAISLLALSLTLGVAGCGAVESNVCTIGGDGCGAHASCVDEAGIATCRCDNGFTGDGMTCADVDECTAATDNCTAEATCTNTAGSFTCACPSGYTGDGTSAGTGCTDVDECATATTCHAMATCTNTAGSFTCACNTGYTGNGMTCSPVDCGALTPPTNGGVMTPGGTTFGQSANYTCNPMYTLTGSPTRMCQANGMWSGNPPTCSGCTVQTMTLTALQSQSVNYPSGGTYSDNSTRAYENPGVTGCAGGGSCDITGWMGFDLSSIPDGASVSAATLRVYANTVQMGPTVQIQLSAINNWTRSTPGTMFPRTIAALSSPTTPALAVYNTYTLNAASINWMTELADNWITLGVFNTQNVYSYAYYDGSDVGGNRPTLQITYCN